MTRSFRSDHEYKKSIHSDASPKELLLSAGLVLTLIESCFIGESISDTTRREMRVTVLDQARRC